MAKLQSDEFFCGNGVYLQRKIFHPKSAEKFNQSKGAVCVRELDYSCCFCGSNIEHDFTITL